MPRPLLTLTTDFGADSGYPAQMKGVLHAALGDAAIVDISHGVAAQNIRAAEVILRGAVWAFPLGTVHVVVVDPGVGTSRRAIAVSHRGMYFVGPDNGVLGAFCAGDSEIVELNRRELFREPVAPTFHGRDIFAPIAAEICAGVPLADLGINTTEFVSTTIPAAVVDGSIIRGEILTTDSFGNLLTNIPSSAGSKTASLLRGEDELCKLKLATTYADGAGDELIALKGSDGFIEVAKNGGDAQAFIRQHYSCDALKLRLLISNSENS